MKDVIPADRPLFEIGPKAYLYGADVVVLARAADRASKEHDITAVLTPPILEARAVADSVEHIFVCIPHLDSARPGRGATDIPPEALTKAGVRMVMLNHAEHLITSTVLEKTMQRAAEVGLAIAVCANSLAEVRAVVSLGPDLLVVELTGLIGTGKPSGFDYVEALNRAAREINPGMRALQGVGTSTSADVEVVIRNGASTTGSSSATATAPDLPAMAEAIIRMAHRGWDARSRS